MIGLFKFLAGPRGRLLQGGLGVLFIFLGLLVAETVLGLLVLAFGLFSLAGGIFDLCFPALIAGWPVEGTKLRKEILRRQLNHSARAR